VGRLVLLLIAGLLSMPPVPLDARAPDDCEVYRDYFCWSNDAGHVEGGKRQAEAGSDSRGAPPPHAVPRSGGYTAPHAPRCRDWRVADADSPAAEFCRFLGRAEPAEPDPGTPPVTISDVERFLPGGGGI
jgi:hypothetical protein